MCLRASSLEEVDVQEGISSIGYDAFSECISLKHISLPSTLRRVDDCAFMRCVSLLSVELPKELSMSWQVFKDCVSLKEVWFR